MKNITLAKRIPEQYVGDDCLQEMIGYNGELLLLRLDEVIYQDTNIGKKVNNYLNDNRRYQFPYYDIPTHYQRILFKKHLFTNQIIDFETPYLELSSNGIISRYAIKDGNEAIMTYEFLMTKEKPQERTLTREEIEAFFDYEDDKTFVYKGNAVGKLILPTIEDILKSYKRYASRVLIENTTASKQTETIIDSLVSNLSINSIPSNYNLLPNNEVILMIKNCNKNMELYLIEIKFINENCYKLIFKKVPISIYNLEQIRNMSTIKSKEPIISLGLNPNIRKEAIERAKKLVRERTKR